MQTMRPYFLLLPGLLLFTFFLIFPLYIVFENSLHEYSRLSGMLPSFSFANYLKILGDSYYLEIAFRTINQAFFTSIFALILGYPIALFLIATSPRKRAIIILFVLSPLLISVIVRTFGWVIILGSNGLLVNTFQYFGIEMDPLLHSRSAVIIGLTNVLLPFMVLSIVTSLQTIDPAVELAASSLGASPFWVFMRVTFPLSIPGVVSGLLIVFSLASSSFVTPSLLGGSKLKVLSGLIYEQAMILQNWPFADALAVFLMVVVFAVIYIQNLLIPNKQKGMVLN